MRTLATVHQRLRHRAMCAPVPAHAACRIYGFQMRTRDTHMLLQTLAATASADAEVGSDREEGGLINTPASTVRKGTKRRRFRSRNSVLDNWLADDKVSRMKHRVMC